MASGEMLCKLEEPFVSKSSASSTASSSSATAVVTTASTTSAAVAFIKGSRSLLSLIGLGPTKSNFLQTVSALPETPLAYDQSTTFDKSAECINHLTPGKSSNTSGDNTESNKKEPCNRVNSNDLNNTESLSTRETEIHYQKQPQALSPSLLTTTTTTKETPNTVSGSNDRVQYINHMNTINMMNVDDYSSGDAAVVAHQEATNKHKQQPSLRLPSQKQNGYLVEHTQRYPKTFMLPQQQNSSIPSATATTTTGAVDDNGYYVYNKGRASGNAMGQYFNLLKGAFRNIWQPSTTWTEPDCVNNFSEQQKTSNYNNTSPSSQQNPQMSSKNTAHIPGQYIYNSQFNSYQSFENVPNYSSEFYSDLPYPSYMPEGSDCCFAQHYWHSEDVIAAQQTELLKYQQQSSSYDQFLSEQKQQYLYYQRLHEQKLQNDAVLGLTGEMTEDSIVDSSWCFVSNEACHLPSISSRDNNSNGLVMPGGVTASLLQCAFPSLSLMKTNLPAFAGQEQLSSMSTRDQHPKNINVESFQLCYSESPDLQVRDGYNYQYSNSFSILSQQPSYDIIKSKNHEGYSVISNNSFTSLNEMSESESYQMSSKNPLNPYAKEWRDESCITSTLNPEAKEWIPKDECCDKSEACGTLIDNSIGDKIVVDIENNKKYLEDTTPKVPCLNLSETLARDNYTEESSDDVNNLPLEQCELSSYDPDDEDYDSDDSLVICFSYSGNDCCIVYDTSDSEESLSSEDEDNLSGKKCVSSEDEDSDDDILFCVDSDSDCNLKYQLGPSCNSAKPTRNKECTEKLLPDQASLQDNCAKSKQKDQKLDSNCEKLDDWDSDSDSSDGCISDRNWAFGVNLIKNSSIKVQTQMIIYVEKERQNSLTEVEKANFNWDLHIDENVKESKGTQVLFNDCVAIYSVDKDVERKGEWEMHARDAMRFRNRIANVSSTLSKVLQNNHRIKIYAERFCNDESFIIENENIDCNKVMTEAVKHKFNSAISFGEKTTNSPISDTNETAGVSSAKKCDVLKPKETVSVSTDNKSGDISNVCLPLNVVVDISLAVFTKDFKETGCKPKEIANTTCSSDLDTCNRIIVPSKQQSVSLGKPR